jgi:hypothetical protein
MARFVLSKVMPSQSARTSAASSGLVVVRAEARRARDRTVTDPGLVTQPLGVAGFSELSDGLESRRVA